MFEDIENSPFGAKMNIPEQSRVNLLGLRQLSFVPVSSLGKRASANKTVGCNLQRLDFPTTPPKKSPDDIRFLHTAVLASRVIGWLPMSRETPQPGLELLDIPVGDLLSTGSQVGQCTVRPLTQDPTTGSPC